MFWFVAYLVATFFLNHLVAQVHWARNEKRIVPKSGILLRITAVIATLLRLPFYAAGVALYNACCLGTIIAAATDLIPEHPFTLWIYVLADNLGAVSFAVRAMLVQQFDVLYKYAQSDWSFIYYDYHLGNGKLFCVHVPPQNGYRRHDVGCSVRARFIYTARDLVRERK